MISSETNRLFFEHWKSLGGPGGAIPNRDTFDPIAVPRSVLDHLFLTEIEDAPFRVKVLLQGDFITGQAGQSFRGQYIGPDTFGDAWESVLAVYRRVVEDGIPMRSVERHTGAHGWHMISEVLHAPLTRHGDRVDFVVGCFDRFREEGTSTAPGRTESWEVLEVGPIM